MPIPTTPSPTLCRRLHRDEVFELVLEAIVSGQLGEGERLHDTDLEDWLGVSRTPIRMALARLEDLSLVETVPKRYTRVSTARPWLVRPLLSTLCSLADLALAEAIADDAARVAVATALGGPLPVDEEARVASPTAPPVIEALVSAAESMATASSNRRLAQLMGHFGPTVLFHARFIGDDLDEAGLSAALAALRAAVARADLGASRVALAEIASAPVLLSVVRAGSAAA